MGFDGKRVIVTGSTWVIDLATARLFIERGAQVVGHGQSEESVARATSEIGGGHGIAAELDTVDGCDGLIAKSLAALVGLDILVNNTALGEANTLGSTTPAEWQAMMDVNLRAPFFLSQTPLPSLRCPGATSLWSHRSRA